MNTEYSPSTTDFGIYEIKAKWKIDDFFQKLESPLLLRFEISPFSTQRSDLKLTLFNYPQNNLYLDIDLSSKTGHKQRCRCIIGIHKIDGSYFYHHDALLEIDKRLHLTLPKLEDFLALKCDLNSIGSLIILFHITITLSEKIDFPRAFPKTCLQEAASQTESLESFQTLSKDFRELFVSQRHADVKIKVGDKEFQAHKSVLTARSSVLDSMFSQQMLENISGVVNINDCDADAFEAFLTFLYSGQLEQIPSSNIVGLYGIADKYDLPELKNECVKRLILELSMESIYDALRLAALYEEKELMEIASNFFIDNAEEALESSKWESFNNDHLKIGTELFKLYIKKSKGSLNK